MGGPLAVSESPALGRGQVRPQQGLLARCDFELFELGLRGPGAYADRPAMHRPGRRRGEPHVGRQYHVAPVAAEHLLHVVRRRAVSPRGVEIDQVGVPPLVVQVGEQRGVGRHHDHVAVALHAGHESRLGHGRTQVPLAGQLRHGVFAHVDLRPLALVAVVAGRVAGEELGTGIVVLVDDVGRALGGRAIGNQLHLRIAGLDRVVEQRVTLLVGRAAVLVADLHVFQPERLGVPLPWPASHPSGSRPVRWHTRWRPMRPGPTPASAPWARSPCATCPR